MAFIDTNLTFSKQVCDICVGGIGGVIGSMYFLGRILIILLGFYAVYRITQIFVLKYKKDKEISIEWNRNKKTKS